MRYLHLYNMAFGWVSQASLLQQLHGWDMPWVLWQWVYETKFDFTSAISPLVPYRPRVSYGSTLDRQSISGPRPVQYLQRSGLLVCRSDRKRVHRLEYEGI